MRLQLREAFDLIDQDGSGAIDVDELEEAFKVPPPARNLRMELNS